MCKFGGFSIEAIFAIDADSSFKSLSSKNLDLKEQTECAPLGHISWIRQMMGRGVVRSAQLCGARDIAADCHASRRIDRALLLQ
eukprot:7283917-Pyramimonas_sp.AAC.1